MNIQKLLSKGHLVPIYEAREDTIFLIGYRRKARSRKASQRPYMLPQPLALGRITKDPEPNYETGNQGIPESANEISNEQ